MANKSQFPRLRCRLFLLLIAAWLVTSVVSIVLLLRDYSSSQSFTSPLPTISQVISPRLTPTPSLSPTPPLAPITSISLDAPFVSQAPSGQWSDPRFQDACEETSSLIAYSWAKDLPITNRSATDEIVAMADFQSQQYANFIDTSARDTAERILDGYFNYPHYEIVTLQDSEQLIRILLSGQLIVAPTNGQILNNPNFTAPGPLRHMLVVSGYDTETNEFITQDPGTRLGRNFRYSRQNLWNAIRDYETGNHAPISQDSPTTIIIVSKN